MEVNVEECLISIHLHFLILDDGGRGRGAGIKTPTLSHANFKLQLSWKNQDFA